MCIVLLKLYTLTVSIVHKYIMFRLEIVQIGNVHIRNIQIRNVQIGNVQIGNVQIGNTQIDNKIRLEMSKVILLLLYFPYLLATLSETLSSLTFAK